MKIDKALVAHVAGLAKLDLSGDEVSYYETQLSRILDYVAQLKDLPDTTTLQAGGRGDAGASAPERPDVVLPSLPPEVAVAAAPLHQGNQFQVPRIIE